MTCVCGHEDSQHSAKDGCEASIWSDWIWGCSCDKFVAKGREQEDES